ncbi:uncharacterized protein LOC134274419 [Saccostrea cucullata]|uniref:uncharacterized protein LOC134274419 n=1 Tax=Saccostrea cuccullata TaxID=36930 RepID=UPI002ED03BB8
MLLSELSDAMNDKALNIITNLEVRRSAGVNPNNVFVFPNTKTSMGHVVGWDCVNRMCREAKLEHNLNATLWQQNMRHWILPHLIENETFVGTVHKEKNVIMKWKLVPVLIPNDCWKVLNIITNLKVRRSAGVNPNNVFVFPNTKTSMGHVVGGDCVNRMCREAKLEHNLNVTGMRHFMATEYAALDFAPSDREFFFKQMGDSETINENICQCPQL